VPLHQGGECSSILVVDKAQEQLLVVLPAVVRAGCNLANMLEDSVERLVCHDWSLPVAFRSLI
jgi:hypothetical protein